MMKKNVFFMFAVTLLTLIGNAQINFNDVSVEAWCGTGSHEAMFVVDFDSDAIGTDSTFAWGIRFDADSISGDSILSLIASSDNNFSYDMLGSFLNNINYLYNSINYTNPNAGWFSILESTDGINWNWNNGIDDKVADQEWFGIVVMNTVTYEAVINVPLSTSVKEINHESTINVFPNPATDYINISLNTPAEISILNLNGQCLYKNITMSDKINLAAYAPGTYIIKIRNSNGNDTYKKIIKK